MQLTIQQIIRWEQLRGKPFAQMNYTDSDDIMALYYLCCLIQKTKQTFTEAKQHIHQQDINNFLEEFDLYTKMLAQFTVPSQQEEKQQANTPEPAQEQKPLYIRQIVALLILSGLDASYALHQLSLCDLPLFIEAYETNKKERLEEQRLWTYISVSPYLPATITAPQDLYPFAWETKQDTVNESATLENSQEIFQEFMRQGKGLVR